MIGGPCNPDPLSNQRCKSQSLPKLPSQYALFLFVVDKRLTIRLGYLQLFLLDLRSTEMT